MKIQSLEVQKVNDFCYPDFDLAELEIINIHQGPIFLGNIIDTNYRCQKCGKVHSKEMVQEAIRRTRERGKSNG